MLPAGSGPPDPGGTCDGGRTKGRSGMQVTEGQEVRIGKKLVAGREDKVVLAFYKPGGDRVYGRPQREEKHGKVPGLSGQSHLRRTAGQGFRRPSDHDQRRGSDQPYDAGPVFP